MDALGEELEYDDVQQLLERFEYDSEKIMDHILKNKGPLFFPFVLKEHKLKNFKMLSYKRSIQLKLPVKNHLLI